MGVLKWTFIPFLVPGEKRQEDEICHKIQWFPDKRYYSGAYLGAVRD